MPLDATPGGSAANSYATLGDIGAYHTLHPAGETWFLTILSREALAVQATRLIERHAAWAGTRTTTTQALSWPRAGVIDAQTKLLIPSTSIPAWLIEAQAELARWLIHHPDPAADVSGLGRVRLADVEVELTAQSTPAFPSSVQALLAPYIVGGSGIVKRLVRM